MVSPPVIPGWCSEQALPNPPIISTEGLVACSEAMLGVACVPDLRLLCAQEQVARRFRMAQWADGVL